MIKPILILGLLLSIASTAHAQDFARPAMTAASPEELLGNRCRLDNLGDAKVTICLPNNIMKGAIAGVTLTPLDTAWTLDDLKRHTRETFHESGIRKIVREEQVKLNHTPDAILLESVYETNLGLRRAWTAYHDGVLIRVIISVISQEDDGDYRDEIMDKVFGPERFAAAPATGGETTDE